MKPAFVIFAAGGFWMSTAGLTPAVESNSAPAAVVSAQPPRTAGGGGTPSARRASPIFTGSSLPVPPMQNAPWIPPQSGFPTNYISATSDLFAQGMADPRGCDYREIEVGTGNVWSGDGGVMATHGWILPGPSSNRFAVCWNGMVYPVVSVGTNASLDADVAVSETNGFGGWFPGGPPVTSEAISVSPTSPLDLKGCLLLRLGRNDLAGRFWLAQQRHRSDFAIRMQRQFSPGSNVIANLTATNEVKLPDTDPYREWAQEWTETMFDRTVCAHERGDEKLALFTARQLAAAQPLIEAECAQRGFKRQPNYAYQHRNESSPYLPFLSQLSEILADLERRESEGPRVGIPSLNLTHATSQAERITALIHDLDLVGARQWGQPGGVNLANDPIVARLIAEGDAAVEPLMDCLEHDKRLTRSVQFRRDFLPGRYVIPVSSAADAALQSILQAGFSSPAEMRAYWSKYKSLKLEDRWYAILNDDAARGRWSEAAAHIVQPENVATFPGGFRTVSPVPSNAPVRLRGEILRAKSNPSVSELLARRALEIPTNNIATYDLSFCCQMAEDLAQWDAAAGLPVAKILVKRACRVMLYSDSPLGSAVAKLSLARANAGDPEAFDDYAKWIVTSAPEQLGNSLPDCLEPLLKFPTNEVLRAASLKLFADTNSPWAKLPWEGNSFFNPLQSDLVNNHGFRLLLVRELSNTNVCGSVTWHGNRSLGYTLAELNQSGTFGAFDLPPGFPATNGMTNPIRSCDWTTLLLSLGRRLPAFNPLAPVAERDQMIEADQAHLLNPAP